MERCRWITYLFPHIENYSSNSGSPQNNPLFCFSPPPIISVILHHASCLLLCLSACCMFRTRTWRWIMKWMTLIRVEHWWAFKCSCSLYQLRLPSLSLLCFPESPRCSPNRITYLDQTITIQVKDQIWSPKKPKLDHNQMFPAETVQTLHYGWTRQRKSSICFRSGNETL